MSGRSDWSEILKDRDKLLRKLGLEDTYPHYIVKTKEGDKNERAVK